MERNKLWPSIDAERQALADDLEQVDAPLWLTPSLCAGLSVREVLAHLTVSGSLSGPRWFAGVLRARSTSTDKWMTACASNSARPRPRR